MNYKELTAPCGLDCFNCQMFEGNITNEIATAYSNATKMPIEKVPCKGCRSCDGCRLHYTKCETLECVKEKGVEFCYECSEFPCVKLHPCLDGAEKYPHNIKLYNLCRMKQIGVEEWAKEALLNKARYFKGKLIVGTGVVLEKN
jgi:hypothetical protein